MRTATERYPKTPGLPDGASRIPAASVEQRTDMPADRTIGRKGQRQKNLVIVGAGNRARDLAQAIERHPELGYRLIGYVQDGSNVAASGEVRILGRTSDLPSIITTYHVDHVIVATGPSWQEDLVRWLLDTGQERRVQVRILPSLFEAMIAGMRFDPIEDIPLGQITDGGTLVGYTAGKRLLDLATSMLMLSLFSIPTAVFCALIKLTSPGAVVFRQQRVGRAGRLFTLYKLRTMVNDAEKHTGPVLADPYDQRVTTLGRFLRATRLDEIPQFVNVLLGQMSVVGPRPERPEFVSEFEDAIPGYAKRHEVLPGITGLAQVYGGYRTSVYNKVRYDWYYVYRRSLALDLSILLLTAATVLKRKGS